MKYTLDKSKKNEIKINFELAPAEWEAANVEAYEKNKKKYSLPGFRKGKVPRKVLEKAYGETLFLEEAFNIAFGKYYSEVLDKEESIYPVDRPNIGLEDITPEGVKFSAAVTVRPEIKLGQYKNLTIKKITAKVTAKEVDAEIQRVRERNARRLNVENRAAQNGDIVTLDYSGSAGGVKFEGGTAEKQELEIGSKSFIDGFEEQLIGMEIGGAKDIKVKFPEDYHAKGLSGKEAVFAVKIHAIAVKELPELNDEFAKDVSSFDTFKEYKKDVEDKLLKSSEARAAVENENAILKAVGEKTAVDIPKCMIDSHIDHMMQDFEYRLMYQGMKLDDYLKYTGKKLEDLRKDREADANEAVKTRLVLEEIIKAEKIDVTEADINAKIEELAKAAGKKPAEYKETLDHHALSRLNNDIIMDKLLKFLTENNKFN